MRDKFERRRRKRARGDGVPRSEEIRGLPPVYLELLTFENATRTSQDEHTHTGELVQGRTAELANQAKQRIADSMNWQT